MGPEELGVILTVQSKPSPDGDGVRRLASELLVLLARERPRFLGFLQRRVSNVDAEDLLQQAMLRAAEHLDTLRNGDRVEGWFYRILRHTLADHLTRQATQQVRLDQLAVEASSAGPEEVAWCACSLGVLERLQPSYREIIQRVDLDEELLGSVAASLGISVNNATVRLHRARKALSESLLAHCGTSSVRSCLECACEAAPPSVKGDRP